MAEASKRMVGNCPIPGCNEPIPEDHPYSWCIRCGERLPDAIQLQLTKLQEGRMKAEAAKAALGSEPQTEEVCAKCGTHFMTSAKLDFLGFRELTCPNCHQRGIIPLRWSYRITYWVFLVVWAMALIELFVENDRNGVELVSVGLWTYILFQAILKDLVLVYRQRLRPRRNA